MMAVAYLLGRKMGNSDIGRVSSQQKMFFEIDAYGSVVWTTTSDFNLV